MECPKESVSRRSRGNAGRFDASHTAPYVFVIAVKAEACTCEINGLSRSMRSSREHRLQSYPLGQDKANLGPLWLAYRRGSVLGLNAPH